MDIPPLPRLRRLFFFTNRQSTILAKYSLGTTELREYELPSALIPERKVRDMEAAPFLTDIHYMDLVRPMFSGRAEIRSFDGPSGTFMHVKVFSPQVCLDGEWASCQSKEDGFGVWQDWTSYQGRLVSTETLLQVYGNRTPFSAPARRKSLPSSAWVALDSCIVSSQQ